MKRPTDYPREQIMKMAEEAIAKYGGPSLARVYFKFTCPACGERCQFQDANKLYETGECHKCGQASEVKEAGFALALGREDGL